MQVAFLGNIDFYRFCLERLNYGILVLNHFRYWPLGGGRRPRRTGSAASISVYILCSLELNEVNDRLDGRHFYSLLLKF